MPQRIGDMKIATLSFQPGALPRTMTREEWRSASRWRRLAERALSREMEEHAAAYEAARRDLGTHGISFMLVGPVVRSAIPPVLVFKR